MSRFALLQTPFDPSNRFTTSWLLSPLILGLIRLSFSIYIFQYLIYRIIYSAIVDGGFGARRSFSYFTNITYWALGFYFAFSAFHTLLYALRGRAPLQRWPPALQFCHALFWSSITTFPFLVTIVYWGILAADDAPFATPGGAYSNISAHALNSGFALFEVLFTRVARPPWIHVPFLILFLAGYLGVAYITYATQGFYTYGFLDPDTGNGTVTAYCFGILAAILVVFAVVWVVVWGRVVVTERVWGRGGKFAVGDVGAGEREGEKRGVEVSNV